jgi:putative oxidoreductase
MFKKYQNSLLLIARLIVGGIFIYAGWLKVADIAGTIEMFAGLSIPAWLTYIVAYAELIGGILVVFGFFTELAAIVLAIIMLVAAYLSREGGAPAYTLPFTMFAALIGFLSGPGNYNIERCILRKKN